MEAAIGHTGFAAAQVAERGPAVRTRDRLVARWGSLRLDRALAEGVSPEASGALLLRARALGGRSRRELGRSLQRILRQAQPSPSAGGRVPVSRSAVMDARDDLDLLARRLLSGAPVDVRGVAQARVLLSDGSGPLFWRRSPESLRARIHEAIEALEPRIPHRPAWAGGKEQRR
jgi:hypothetical protein